MLRARLTGTGFLLLREATTRSLVLALMGASVLFASTRTPVVVGEPFVLQARVPGKALSKSVGNDHYITIAALKTEGYRSNNALERGWRQVSQVGDVVTLRGRAKELVNLNDLAGLGALSRPFERPDFSPLMDTARKYSFIDQLDGERPSNLPQAYTGEGVLLGMIDTEFDTHHPAFLDSAGKTRFVALWDQTDSLFNSPPAPYDYGSVRIGSQLQGDTLFGLGTTPHGTGMSGFAAGFDRGNPHLRGVATQAVLAAVKYPRGGDINAAIIDALTWLFDLADSLGLPCVINMSIGLSYGPHDGTSLVDRTVDNLSGPGRIVVGAGGNDGTARSHVRFTLGSGASAGTWIAHHVETLSQDPVQQRTWAGIDIWGQAQKDLTLTPVLLDTVTMQSRRGTAVLSRRFSTPRVLMPDTIIGPGATDTSIFYMLVERSSSLNGKPHIELQIVGNNPHVLPGVEVVQSSGGIVDAWNVNKKALLDLGISTYVQGDSAFTINEVGGTAKRIITVGMTVNKTAVTTWDGILIQRKSDDLRLGLADYSSRGPTADGRTKPDLVAPGDALAGALARNADLFLELVVWPDQSNTRGRYSINGGTSVSAPIVAGTVACMLQARPTLAPEQARETLTATAYTDDKTGPLVSPDNNWGSGKLNALGALQSLVGVPVGGDRPAPATTLSAPRLVQQRGGFLNVLLEPTFQSGPWQLEIYTMGGRLLSCSVLKASAVVPLPQSAGGSIGIIRLRNPYGQEYRSAVTLGEVN